MPGPALAVSAAGQVGDQLRGGSMFRGGERVRVPNPEGEGTVAAIFVAPADSRRRVDVAWVRYEDGPDQGLNAKVRLGDIERE